MSLLNLFAKKYSAKEKALFTILRKSSIFNSLTDHELFLFIPTIHTRQYVKKEVVFFTNDPSKALYLIKDGEVSLNFEHRKRFEKLHVIHRGKAFGENVLLEKSKREYTAIIESEKASILVIPGISIDDICEKHSKVKAKIYSAIAEIYAVNIKLIYKKYQESSGFFELEGLYSDSDQY